MATGFTASEAEDRARRFRRGEVLPLLFTHSALNTGLTLTAAAFATFTADRDYALRRIVISAGNVEATTPLRGLVALTISDLAAADLLGATKVWRGNILAALAYRLEAAQEFSFGAGGDEKENVYLEKGKTLCAHLRNASADGTSWCAIQVQLLPVGKQ